MHTEELIISTYERMNDAFEHNLDNTIAYIEKRAIQLDSQFKGPQYKWINN